MSKTIAQRIAELVVARRNCEKMDNPQWHKIHGERLAGIMDLSPSGSGWDCGTTLVESSCNDTVLVFSGAYHHMDEMGGYDGWTEHVIRARASFLGLSIAVSGRDRNGIKDYLADLFHCWLTENYEEVNDA